MASRRGLADRAFARGNADGDDLQVHVALLSRQGAEVRAAPGTDRLRLRVAADRADHRRPVGGAILRIFVKRRGSVSDASAMSRVAWLRVGQGASRARALARGAREGGVFAPPKAARCPAP